MTHMPPWNDPSLLAPGEPRHRAQYRLLQSWYRETILQLPPGISRQRNAPVGNMLPEEAVAANPGLNFLDPLITAYVAERSQQVLAEGGTLEEDRLSRNMLSSMPLCFNLFGYLRNHKAALARVLSRFLSLDIAEVEDAVVEWAPDRDLHLRDRTAFDACVWYRTRDGRRGLLGIETKYTEPFSQQEYANAEYLRVTRAHPDVFRPGAENILGGRTTNQLWRNALLALSVGDQEGVLVHSVVLYAAGDPTAEKSIAAFQEQLVEGSDFCRPLTLQGLIEACKAEESLTHWGEAFEQRYLDLRPVLQVVPS